jgi:hypothetical protein
MRAPLIAIVLSSVGGGVCAQPMSEVVKELETCFQSTRAAHAICSDSKNSEAERLDCLQKVRTYHLECLEQVLRGTSAGSAPAEKPAGTGSSELPAVTGSPEVPAGSASPEMPTGTVSPSEPSTLLKKTPPGIVQPETPTATVSPAEMTTGTTSPSVPARSVDIPPPDTNWLVSETTSPVDFTPLLTAMTRLPSSMKHAPNMLAIRCRGGRTELLVRTGGTWRVSRAREVQIEYQINDQPSVRLAWAASADGKTAIYKDDPVGLLRSLPEAARLKINMLDEPDPNHEATFPLAGLDAVRGKIAAACQWPPVANTMPSEKG